MKRFLTWFRRGKVLNVILPKLFSHDHGWANGDGFRKVLCPVCSYDYSHFGEFDTSKGIDEYDTKAKNWRGRGDVVRVMFDGECGHVWAYCFGQHKGNTTFWVEELPAKYHPDHQRNSMSDADIEAGCVPL